MNNEIGKIYERPWGTYQTLLLASGYQIKIIQVHPGGRLSLQKHRKRSEHWVVVDGSPMLTIEDNVRIYHVDESVYIPKEAVHRIENLTSQPCTLIEVQVGEYLGEDDIVRLEDAYGRGN